MWINEEKTYGELMSFLLQKRRHHGTDDRFRTYIADAVQEFARDLRDFDLELNIEKKAPRPAAARPELKRLHVSCE
jgi:hypothetical protein